MKHWLSRQCCSELIKFVNLNLTYVKLDRIWRNFIFKTDDSIHFCRRKLSYKIVAPFMGNWGMCVNFFICNFLGRNEQALWMVRYGAPSNEFSTTSRESRFLSFLFSFQVNNSQNCLNLCRTWCKNSKIYHLKAKKLDFTNEVERLGDFVVPSLDMKREDSEIQNLSQHFSKFVTKYHSLKNRSKR